MQLVSEPEENQKLAAKTGLREITTEIMEFNLESNVSIDIEYKTYFPPVNPFSRRITREPTIIVPFMKLEQGLLILAKDGSPFAFLKPNETPKKAELTYLNRRSKTRR